MTRQIAWGDKAGRAGLSQRLVFHPWGRPGGEPQP
ncbi:hypothetical protein PHLH7_24120 [Pseudomonas sp. Ost2]|nr:hypothetical protein PHLH7_24120 [Pseudomonas sp. Ost2]